MVPLCLITVRLDGRATRRWRMRTLFAVAAAVLAVALYAPRADAHAIGLSTGEYTAKGASVTAKLAFARGEVAALAPALEHSK